jgi:glutamate racemase
LGTAGTVQSDSYPIEIAKFFPQVTVYQEACPMWVPLIENNEYNKPGADHFVKQHLQNILAKDKEIDTLLLACTHYPLLIDKIRQVCTGRDQYHITGSDRGKKPGHLP